MFFECSNLKSDIEKSENLEDIVEIESDFDLHRTLVVRQVSPRRINKVSKSELRYIVMDTNSVGGTGILPNNCVIELKLEATSTVLGLSVELKK